MYARLQSQSWETCWDDTDDEEDEDEALVDMSGTAYILHPEEWISGDMSEDHEAQAVSKFPAALSSTLIR